MTATEILRRMMDERDEYYKTSGNKTWWGRPIDRQTGKPINVFHYQAQPMGEDRLLVELQLATPEQAIAATLGPCNCTNSERTDAACKPTTYDDGYSADRVEPGEYYEFWEPACACGNCGELIPMRKFCPNCGSRLEGDA